MAEYYFDHASTTYTDPKVVEAMLPYFTEIYGNSVSGHQQGKKAKIAIDQARKSIAEFLNCQSSEIIFTGSGTESNNLALFGIARANKQKGNHIITSKIEHSSVKNSCLQLEKEGFKITFLDVDEEGFINPQDLKAAITEQTILVSIMYANNEIGTIEPLERIGEICATAGVHFHTDACQAAGVLSLDCQALQLSSMTINGSKIYGPKGAGALYIKAGTPIQAIQFGGGHEKGLRSGTLSTPNIIGLAKALELSQENSAQENTRLSQMRNQLIEELLKQIPHSSLNGPSETPNTSPQKRLPNNINISIQGVDIPQLILILSEKGIYCSSGSACKTGETRPSHVIQALSAKASDQDTKFQTSQKSPHSRSVAKGAPNNAALSSLRLSLGKVTTQEHLDYLIETLPPLIEKMRQS